jgi:uncharacterized membrane protein YkoI
MTIKRIAACALASLLVLGFASEAALAKRARQGEDARDAAALASMKVTLPQAIASAEQQAGGHAVSADIVHRQGITQIAVEVAGAKGVQTLLVDGQTGKVTATADSGHGDDSD